MAKSTEIPSIESLNKIVKGTIIKGDILSDGDIRIDGEVTGSITTKAKLVLGSTGRIEGEVRCKNAEVQGEIRAQLHVEELLSLKSTAKVLGDIYTDKLAIEAGAKLTGTVKMDKKITASAPEIKKNFTNEKLQKTAN